MEKMKWILFLGIGEDEPILIALLPIYFEARHRHVEKMGWSLFLGIGDDEPAQSCFHPCGSKSPQLVGFAQREVLE